MAYLHHSFFPSFILYDIFNDFCGICNGRCISDENRFNTPKIIDLCSRDRRQGTIFARHGSAVFHGGATGRSLMEKHRPHRSKCFGNDALCSFSPFPLFPHRGLHGFVRPCSVRRVFPLRAAHFRCLLPRVDGFLCPQSTMKQSDSPRIVGSLPVSVEHPYPS